ncbi:MAG: hypothetical protein AB7E05_14600 [Sphingobium sp.]
MSLTLIALAAAAATATHTIPVHHAGSVVEAVYTARADIQTRTIGAAVPNRTDMRRCLWTATLIVERQLDGTPATPRIIANDKQLSGSRSGPCSDGKTRSIEQEVASRKDAIHSHLMAVAQRDQAPLLAELDTMRTVASN